jgi:hypothetical protein
MQQQVEPILLFVKLQIKQQFHSYLQNLSVYYQAEAPPFVLDITSLTELFPVQDVIVSQAMEVEADLSALRRTELKRQQTKLGYKFDSLKQESKENVLDFSTNVKRNLQRQEADIILKHSQDI